MNYEKNLTTTADKIDAFSDYAWSIWRWIGASSIMIIAWASVGKWPFLVAGLFAACVPFFAILFRFLAVFSADSPNPNTPTGLKLLIGAIFFTITVALSISVVSVLLSLGFASGESLRTAT